MFLQNKRRKKLRGTGKWSEIEGWSDSDIDKEVAYLLGIKCGWYVYIILQFHVWEERQWVMSRMSHVMMMMMSLFRLIYVLLHLLLITRWWPCQYIDTLSQKTTIFLSHLTGVTVDRLFTMYLLVALPLCTVNITNLFANSKHISYILHFWQAVDWRKCEASVCAHLLFLQWRPLHKSQQPK